MQPSDRFFFFFASCKQPQGMLCGSLCMNEIIQGTIGLQTFTAASGGNFVEKQTRVWMHLQRQVAHDLWPLAILVKVIGHVQLVSDLQLYAKTTRPIQENHTRGLCKTDFKHGWTQASGPAHHNPVTVWPSGFTGKQPTPSVLLNCKKTTTSRSKLEERKRERDVMCICVFHLEILIPSWPTPKRLLYANLGRQWRKWVAARSSANTKPACRGVS